ncbi:hypothetical protein [Okeania sp. SIO3B5]|uniref:hypothetical protein n=1 Tax=Okeania sp. SIO3B5 TaxID=2607811 RepID=UPI0025E7ACD5|nr:hypothetical protein [Okeania sp. SIO3B5]
MKKAEGRRQEAEGRRQKGKLHGYSQRSPTRVSDAPNNFKHPPCLTELITDN